MFLEETLALKNRYIARFAVHFVMSREPQQAAWLNGRIDGDKLRELQRHLVEISTADEYLICGPGGMVDDCELFGIDGGGPRQETQGVQRGEIRRVPSEMRRIVERPAMRGFGR